MEKKQIVLLVIEAKAGSNAAMNQFIEVVRPKILSIASKLCRNNANAEDACQNALVQIWERLHMLNDPEKFSSWTTTIAVNAALTKKRLTGRLVSMTAEMSDGLKCRTDDVPAADISDQVCLYLSLIEQRHRKILESHYLQGLRLKEIAAELKSPVGTVKRQLWEARESLKRAVCSVA